jgi:hypothetical protein
VLPRAGVDASEMFSAHGMRIDATPWWQPIKDETSTALTITHVLRDRF